MTTYRRMRRQSRQARRAGLQPMMLINSGDGFPEPAIVGIARWVRRYRSELAPLGVAFQMAGFGWYGHAALSRWWPLILAVSGVAAWVPAMLGASSASPECWNDSVSPSRCSHAAHGRRWRLRQSGHITTAASTRHRRADPVYSVVGEPRRRRAKVRVERTIARWPDIARTVGLAGSEVMSASVDLWGWRARLRLARGQTIADVMTKIPALDQGSALTGMRSASTRPPMTWPTAVRYASLTAIHMPNRSDGTDRRSHR